MFRLANAGGGGAFTRWFQKSFDSCETTDYMTVHVNSNVGDTVVERLTELSPRHVSQADLRLAKMTRSPVPGARVHRLSLEHSTGCRSNCSRPPGLDVRMCDLSPQRAFHRQRVQHGELLLPILPQTESRLKAFPNLVASYFEQTKYEIGALTDSPTNARAGSTKRRRRRRGGRMALVSYFRSAG